MKKAVLLIGTLDTKGQEFEFVKNEFKKRGVDTIVVDVGTRGEPFFDPDITREEIAKAVGSDSKTLTDDSKKKAVDIMIKGVSVLAGRLYFEDKIAGIMGMGGSAGSLIASAAMKAVPIGIPKIIVSTAASGDVSYYVGEKDICMMYSITDICGLNRISRKVFTNAVAALVGMVKNGQVEGNLKDNSLIAATMMGVTTACVTKAKDNLEKNGYELAVFHAIGSGGRAMETLIKEGLIDAVLDVTLVEIMNNLLGGVCDAGSTRLEAAGEKGIPQVVSCGGIDFINFYGNNISEKYKNRKFFKHDQVVTLMRTSKEENIKVAVIIANKLNKAKGPTAFFIPLRGFSSVDAEGKVFYDPEADNAFVKSLEKHLDPKIELIKCDNHINDVDFALKMSDFIKTMI